MPLPLAPAPAPQATPQAAPQAEAPPTPADLPPPFSDVAAGSLPAVSLPPEPRNRVASPLSSYVAQNLHQLASAGLDLYEGIHKDSVFFNPTKITLEELKKADRAGRLFKVAPLIPQPRQPAAPTGTRTVHAAAPAQPATDLTQSPQAPEQPQPTPQNPVDVKPSKHLQNARVNQLAADNKPAISSPTTVNDRLASRPI
jgi:hypothetical protein